MEVWNDVDSLSPFHSEVEERARGERIENVVTTSTTCVTGSAVSL
jgi:hypothetical protein